jgi:hypothetical protein
MGINDAGDYGVVLTVDRMVSGRQIGIFGNRDHFAPVNRQAGL